MARKDSVRRLAIPEVHKLVVLRLVAPKVAVQNRVAALVDLQDALVSRRLRGMCAADPKALAREGRKDVVPIVIAEARKQVLRVVPNAPVLARRVIPRVLDRKAVVRRAVATMIAAVPKLVHHVVQAQDVVRKVVVRKVVVRKVVVRKVVVRKVVAPKVVAPKVAAPKVAAPKVAAPVATAAHHRAAVAMTT